MYLYLEWLELENFMGGTLRVDFGKQTNIFAANRGGKTRLKDAYSWLITGRNSENEAKFHIKDTLNPEKNILPHRVTACFKKQDGEEVTFQKIYKEDWASVQGSEKKSLKGHSIEYKINGDKKTQGTYEEIMNAMIPANLLKMLSDPLYFPEKMGWEDQRNVLALMANEVTDEYVLDRIATPEKDFGPILAILNKRSTLDERKNRISYEIAELRKSYNPIQPKIEENTLQITNLGTVDVKAINAEIQDLDGQISALDLAISNKADAESIQADQNRVKRNTLNSLKSKDQEISAAHTRQYNTDKSNAVAGKAELEDKITSLQTQKKSKEALLKSLTLKADSLRMQGENIQSRWGVENAKDFPQWDDKNFICQTCNRPHETDNIEAKKSELENTFIENKRNSLLALNAEWALVSKEIEENQQMTETQKPLLSKLSDDLSAAEAELKTLIDKIANATEIKSVATRMAEDKDAIKIIEDIRNLEAELSQVQPIDYGQLKSEKAVLVSKVDALKQQKSKVDTIKYLKERNEVLAADEQKLAQQIAAFQREDLLINEFVIAKSKYIEEIVRSKFQYVNFKMFKTIISDPIPKPTCELWFEGKPWKALNTEAKLNAGLDVVNALSTHYGIFPPLLLDNRESTTEIIGTVSQTINFFVSAKDKILRTEIISN